MDALKALQTALLTKAPQSKLNEEGKLLVAFYLPIADILPKIKAAALRGEFRNNDDWAEMQTAVAELKELKESSGLPSNALYRDMEAWCQTGDLRHALLTVCNNHDIQKIRDTSLQLSELTDRNETIWVEVVRDLDEGQELLDALLEIQAAAGSLDADLLDKAASLSHKVRLPQDHTLFVQLQQARHQFSALQQLVSAVDKYPTGHGSLKADKGVRGSARCSRSGTVLWGEYRSRERGRGSTCCPA